MATTSSPGARQHATLLRRSLGRAAVLGLLLNVAVLMSFDFPTWQVTWMTYSDFRLGWPFSTSMTIQSGIEVPHFLGKFLLCLCLLRLAHLTHGLRLTVDQVVNRVWFPAQLVRSLVNVSICEGRSNCDRRVHIGRAEAGDLYMLYGRNTLTVTTTLHNITLGEARVILRSIENGTVTVRVRGLVDCLSFFGVVPVRLSITCTEVVQVLDRNLQRKMPVHLVHSLCDYDLWGLVLSHGFRGVPATQATKASAPRTTTTWVALGRHFV